MIDVNKIADVDIDFGLNHGFYAYIMEKIRVLIGNHYQLDGHTNGVNYLQSLRTGWIFLNPNPNEVYDMITSVLQLIVLIIFIQTLADLPRL